MSLKSVKNKIRSIDKTRQVTKAMESVSAVKMRKSQSSAIVVRPYATSALKALQSIAGSNAAMHHPLTSARPVKKTLLVVVSADKGLAGNYGSALLKGIYRFLSEKALTKENTAIIAVGKRGYEHFVKRGWTLAGQYKDWSDGCTFRDVKPLAQQVKDLFLSGAYDEVHIAYTNFVTTLRQLVYVRQLLPVNYGSVEQVVRGITPEHGRFADLAKEDGTTPVREYSFEPSPEEVFAQLIPVLFNVQIYHSVLEANASEHSSRMIAMKNASDNAGEISRGLKLHFNKVRQAAITREVSEIVGGMESMRVSDD